MKIYSEERVGWMGSDVAKYRRKRAVSKDTMPGVGPRGIVHPALCFDNDPERLLIFHVRESDVVQSRRMALLKLAWLFMRDALRHRPDMLCVPAELRWSHTSDVKPIGRVVAYDPHTLTLAVELEKAGTGIDGNKPTGPAVQPGGSL